MFGLLSSSFGRMIRSGVFWILCGLFMLGGWYTGMSSAAQGAESVLDAHLFELLPLIIPAASIFSSLFLGADYSYGTIRNKVITGHSRGMIYLSSLILSCIACFLMECGYGLGLWISLLQYAGQIGLPAGLFVSMFSNSFLISASMSSITVLLAMLNEHQSGNVVISLLLSLGMLLISSMVYQRLDAPRMTDNYLNVNEYGVPTAVEQVPNPDYMDEPLRGTLQLFNDILPSGQAIQLADSVDPESGIKEQVQSRIGIWPLCSAGVIVFFTLIGACFFTRKELR